MRKLNKNRDLKVNSIEAYSRCGCGCNCFCFLGINSSNTSNNLNSATQQQGMRG